MSLGGSGGEVGENPKAGTKEDSGVRQESERRGTHKRSWGSEENVDFNIQNRKFFPGIRRTTDSDK